MHRAVTSLKARDVRSKAMRGRTRQADLTSREMVFMTLATLVTHFEPGETAVLDTALAMPFALTEAYAARLAAFVLCPEADQAAHDGRSTAVLIGVSPARPVWFRTAREYVQEDCADVGHRTRG
jgi:hypothetical protein